MNMLWVVLACIGCINSTLEDSQIVHQFLCEPSGRSRYLISFPNHPSLSSSPPIPTLQ